jgi:hypothetical protein
MCSFFNTHRTGGADNFRHRGTAHHSCGIEGDADHGHGAGVKLPSWMSPTKLLAWVEHERAWAAYTTSNSFQDKANKESAAGKGRVDNDAACTRHAAASTRRGYLLDALMDSGSPLWPPSVRWAIWLLPAAQKVFGRVMICNGHFESKRH